MVAALHAGARRSPGPNNRREAAARRFAPTGRVRAVTDVEFAVVARAILADAGLPCTDGDLELLAVVAEVLRPGMAALNEIDLSSLPPEHDLDPARAPR